jgi:radical SAM superfamily enzyme YgiQ (UPF0313 family)
LRSRDPFEMLKPHLLALQRPGRYIGHEMNALYIPWDSAQVRVALLFPDAYEIGMSNLGFQILYHALGKVRGVLVDRAYLPWPDAQEVMLNKGIPLFAHESRRPLKEFDLVGISLQTEIAATNLLQSLRLAEIPLLAEDRKGKDPIILGGGPCALNPAPIGPLFDALFMGEADEAITEIAQVLRESRGEERDKVLKELGKIEGVFIPSNPRPVKRRRVSLHSSPHPTSFLVSHSEVSHQRIPVEIMRGCDRGCRFCHAGFTTRPVRERSASQVCGIAQQAIGFTGHDTISLLSLSTSDHSQIVPAVENLLPLLRERQVTLSMPSLRAGSLTPRLITAMEGLRRAGFTIAPEAGSQRLRQVINKGITHQEVVETARLAFENGWEMVKLYFMMGLPTETEEDLREMARLVREVWQIAKKHARRRGKVHVSVAPFVPKPHTPFQWEPQITLDEMEERSRLLRRILPKGRAFNLDIHNPQQSFIEAIISRGDEQVFNLIRLAHSKGCKMDQWHEWFRFDLWEEAIAQSGVDIDSLIHRERERDEPFPWEIVDVGVTKEFLWRERMKALEAIETPPCRERCSGCGVCKGGEGLEIGAAEKPPAEETTKKAIYIPPSRTTRLRMVLKRTGESALIAHNSFTDFFIRLLRKHQVPLAYSQGFHPQAKVSFALALPVGMESMGEPCEITVRGEFSAQDFPRKEVNSELPPGAQVLEVEEIDPALPSLTKSIRAIRYKVELHSPPLEKVPSVEELQPLGEDPLVDEVEFSENRNGPSVRLLTIGKEGRFAKPYQLMKEILGLENGEERLLRVTRERILLEQ